MPATQWTNAFLDEMRTHGDPLADAAVNALFLEGDIKAVDELMQTLVRNDGMPSDKLPPVILDYLAQTSAIPLLDPDKVRRGEELFGVYGPEILMVLGFYSLPAAYAARKGVQVLYRTGYLLHRPMRRVFETTQMVVDVMAKGGLEADGRGVRSAQKVRLMHAAIRHLVSKDPKNPWDPEFGFPINQEDLAGTLMTFSYIVLDGLKRMGITLSEADQDAYLHAWLAIGRIMGVREDLLPATVGAARDLTTLIHQRQIASSAEGKALANALIEGYQKLMPAPFLKGVPASLTHFFLDVDTFTGQDIAAMLDIPPADWTEAIAHIVGAIGNALGQFELGHGLVEAVFGYVSRAMIEAMLLLERGGTRAPFFIPDHLRTQWKLDPKRDTAAA